MRSDEDRHTHSGTIASVRERITAISRIPLWLD